MVDGKPEEKSLGDVEAVRFDLIDEDSDSDQGEAVEFERPTTLCNISGD